MPDGSIGLVDGRGVHTHRATPARRSFSKSAVFLLPKTVFWSIAWNRFDDFLRRFHVERHMRPFVVVIAEIFGQLFPPPAQIHRDALQALVLNGPIETLEMGIVVRCSDAAVPVRHAALQDAFREPL